MTTALTANKPVSTQQLKRTFIVLKNQQQDYLSPKEALETSFKISKIKRELIERGIEPKSLV